MAGNNPIQSHDLYTPGPQDMLDLLKRELIAIQGAVTSLNKEAAALKKTLASSTQSPAKVVAAATEAERIASAKRILLLREEAAAQKIANQQKKQAIIDEKQIAAATSRANVAREREVAAINRINKAQQSHSSTLKGLIGSIRNLAVAYFSLGAAAQVFQSILRQTKALDTLTVAFNTTLGSAQATAQAQEYLLDISERFGTNLLGASQAYLKFSAASKQAGVSAKVTQDIFTSVTKASSILGLGAERTSYVFLALEQIMSKGRLSTEELRRQLGEHLPGAFGIAAQSIGVTTAKLTDMLKKGEIASTDFLPKFAKQLEIAYGIQNVERIDNLAAAQERFNNQLTLLIKELNLSNAFKDFFNTLADGVKFIVQNIEGITKLAKAVLQLVIAYTAYKAIMIANRALTTFFLVDSLKQLTMTKALEAAQLRLSLAIKAVNVAWKTNPLGVIVAVAATLISALTILNKRLNVTAELQKSLSDATAKASAESEYQEFALKRLTDEYDKNETALYSLEKGTDAYNEIADKQKGILTELNNLGVTAIDINGDHVISTNELTIAKDKYIQKLEEEIYLEELNARLKEAISKRISEEQKLENFNFKSIFFNPIALFQAGGTTAELKSVNELIDKIKAAIKARKKDFTVAPIAGGSPEDLNPDDGSKDKFDAEKERLALILNNQERELAELKLAYERKKADFIANNEDITVLEDKYAHDRAEIINKYLDIEIQAFNDAEEEKKKAFKQATDDVKKYLDQRRQAIEDAENKRKKNVDTLRDEFNARREHEQALFDLSKHTEEEKKAFALRLQAEELNDEIQLHRTFGKVLNDEELARAIELRDKIRAQLTKDGRLITPLESKGEETDIFSLLNINFKSDDQRDAFKDTIAFVGNELIKFNQLQQELINQQIEDADRLVKAKEENLNRQIALAAANQANNVAGAQAELALAKKTQAEAIKQRKAAQRTELAIETLSQTQNMITAVTAALKLGPILGPIAVGALFAVFAASRIKALQLINKKTFRKGGFEEIGGGSHESGKDTHVGGGNYAERGESVGIFNAKATRNYKPTLKALVNAANKGMLEQVLVQDRRAIAGMNLTQNMSVDTSLMEKRLTRLVSLSEAKTFVDGKGRLVKIDRGRKTIIN